jgi:triosephosphate isomerase
MFVIGNWKMNGSLTLCDEFTNKLAIQNGVEVIICPPAIYAHYIIRSARGFEVGAQDCSRFQSGSYTGEIGAEMLKEIGLKYAIVGHSERIKYHDETKDILLEKLARCNESGINPILCVDGETPSDIREQMNVFKDKVQIIAYEPSYCIGTGIIPTNEQIEEIFDVIREFGDFKTIYGGSVSPQNIQELSKIRGLDGVLVGGASLKFDQFNQIIVGLSKEK